jgi:hypothetical protein
MVVTVAKAEMEGMRTRALHIALAMVEMAVTVAMEVTEQLVAH